MNEKKNIQVLDVKRVSLASLEYRRFQISGIIVEYYKSNAKSDIIGIYFNSFLNQFPKTGTSDVNIYCSTTENSHGISIYPLSFFLNSPFKERKKAVYTL